jgi:hypothetical protein
MKLMLMSAAPAALAGAAAAQEARADGAVPDARLTAPLSPPARGEINVAFLISDGAEVVDFSCPWGVLNMC